MFLKEFAYLDTRRIQDFVSLLEGGLAKEMTQKRQEISADARGEVGIPHVMKVGAGLGRKGAESEELRTATNVSLFQRLYSHLEREKLCRKLDSVDEKVLGKIKKGELLEFEGDIEISAMDKFMRVFASYRNFIPVQDQKSKSAMDLINKVLSRKGFNIKITLRNAPKFKFVGYLLEKNLRIELEELEDEYFILCRVRKVLKRNENLELFSLPQIKTPKSITKKLIRDFRNLPPETQMVFGGPIKMEDFIVPYPAFLVTPIAIYR